MWEAVKMILTIVFSYLFTMLIAKYPNFPIDEKTFVNLLLWIVALAIPIRYFVEKARQGYLSNIK